jgi:hypothetical protein
MSAKAQWLRLSVNWSDSAWLAALPWEVRAVWVEILPIMKKLGRGGSMTKIPLGRLAGMKDIPVQYVEAFMSAAIAAGAIEDDGESWTIVKWKDYQPDDATRVDRQRAWREKKREETTEHNDVMPSLSAENDGHNSVTTSCATTDHRPPTYKQEVSTIALPNGNEKALVAAAPFWWDAPEVPIAIKDAVLALCAVPRFKRRFLDPNAVLVEKEAMIRCLQKSREKSFSDSEFVALAQACMNYFASKRGNVSGALSLENWIRNQKVIQKSKSAPGEWMGKTFGRGDDHQVSTPVIEGNVIHAKF